MNNDVSSSKFWDDCYINHNIGWDLGTVTPVFKDWCDKRIIFERNWRGKAKKMDGGSTEPRCKG